jgi:hypothetical protein
VLPFFGLVHNTLSRSHFFVFRAIFSVFPFAEALATCDLLFHAAHLRSFSPPFFSHGKFQLITPSGGSFPIQLSLPDPPTLAPPLLVHTSRPPLFARSLSFALSLPTLHSSSSPSVFPLPNDPGRLFITYSELLSCSSSPILEYALPFSIPGPVGSALGDPPASQEPT